MVARLRVGEGLGVRGLQHRAGGTGILLGKARKLEAARFATLNFTLHLIARSLSAVVFVPPKHHDVDTEAPLSIATQNNTLVFSFLVSL